MGVEVYQRTVGSKIVVGGIYTKMGVSDGGMRHVYAVNNFLKERGRTVVRVNVVNGGELDGGKKSKTHCIFNQRNHQIT